MEIPIAQKMIRITGFNVKLICEKRDQPQYRDLKDNQPNTTTNQQP